MYHQGGSEKIDVQLAVSRDCTNWRRVANRQVFIANGEDDEWDAGIIFTASQPLQVVGDTVLIFYSGTPHKHNTDLRKHYRAPESEERRRALAMPSIGVATIRRDGFVSMDAGEAEGTLTTIAFIWPANRSLHVNVDAAAGDLVAEVIDEIDKIVATATPITGDHRRIKAAMGTQLNAQQRNDVRIRFRLRNGKLFSFWFE